MTAADATTRTDSNRAQGSMYADQGGMPSAREMDLNHQVREAEADTPEAVVQTAGSSTDTAAIGTSDIQPTETDRREIMTVTTAIANETATLDETVTETRISDEMMTTGVLATTNNANILMTGMGNADMNTITESRVTKGSTDAEAAIGVPDHTRTRIDTATMMEIETTEIETREADLIEAAQEAVSFSIIETKILDADLLQMKKSTTEAMQSGN